MLVPNVALKTSASNLVEQKTMAMSFTIPVMTKMKMNMKSAIQSFGNERGHRAADTLMTERFT